MSLELVVERSKKLEGLLKRLGYQGRGLHELVSQAEPVLDDDVVRACRKVATIRNKAVHEEGYRLHGRALRDFEEAADFAADQLLTHVSAGPFRTARRDSRAAVGRMPVRRSGVGRRAGGRAPHRAPLTAKDYLTAMIVFVAALCFWLWKGVGH